MLLVINILLSVTLPAESNKIIWTPNDILNINLLDNGDFEKGKIDWEIMGTDNEVKFELIEVYLY